MNDVTLKFNDFHYTLTHIIERLQSNTIVKVKYPKSIESDYEYLEYCKQTGEDEKYKNYQFILHKSSFENQDIPLKVLHFLSGENYVFCGNEGIAGQGNFTPLTFTELTDKYSIQILDSRGLKCLQSLHYYTSSIFNNESKQSAIMELINAPKPEYTDDKVDFLEVCGFAFDNDIVFPKIQDNEAKCDDGSSITAFNHIAINTQNVIPKPIPKKEAIRNEYISHYNAHSSDYDNKETLEDDIYAKLKPLHKTLSKAEIQTIGKEVRKERGMNNKGRPQGRGNVKRG